MVAAREASDTCETPELACKQGGRDTPVGVDFPVTAGRRYDVSFARLFGTGRFYALSIGCR
jgi:hypothetical protein